MKLTIWQRLYRIIRPLKVNEGYISVPRHMRWTITDLIRREGREPGGGRAVPRRPGTKYIGTLTKGSVAKFDNRGRLWIANKERPVDEMELLCGGWTKEHAHTFFALETAEKKVNAIDTIPWLREVERRIDRALHPPMTEDGRLL